MAAAARTVLRHPGVRWIGLGWTAFIAENIILSENRQWIISEFGNSTYHGAYNCLSTAATGSIVYGFFKHARGGQGPRLRASPTPPLLRAAALGLQAVGLIGFSQLAPELQIPYAPQLRASSPGTAGSRERGPAAPRRDDVGSGKVEPGMVWAARCPFDFSPKDVPEDGVYGTKRVTRHPALWSLGLAGLGAALATPFAPSFVMFVFPSVFALVGGAHQDSRFRRGMGGTLTPEVDAKTSNVPFWALVSGRQPWGKLGEELKVSNAGIAIVAAVLLALRRRRLGF
jgi:uncharacterized membrane protein